jgi:hypothetical protein
MGLVVMRRTVTSGRGFLRAKVGNKWQDLGVGYGVPC